MKRLKPISPKSSPPSKDPSTGRLSVVRLPQLPSPAISATTSSRLSTLPHLPAASGRLLDFDIETRRIGFHDGGRFAPTGCEPVIVAAAWSTGRIETRSLGQTWREDDARAILEWFVGLWEEAEAVTGHYIRKFDLPILNGCLREWGYPPLSPKPTIDTKDDMVKAAGMSKSQENLSEMLRIGSKKFHMNDQLWRQVARLTPYGLEEARKRVVADVRQHRKLRQELAKEWLHPRRVWAA